jgi:DNA polymerase III sliding clamp (beta) subunit (PCNA family)
VPILIPKSVAKVVQMAAEDTARASMAGVRVENYAEDCWRLVVTDGRRLAIVGGDSQPPEPGLKRYYEKTAAALGDAPEGGTVAVLPADAWEKAFKMGDKRDPVALALAPGNNSFVLASGGQILHTLAQEGRYPDYTKVLPHNRPPLVRFRVDPDYLASLLKFIGSMQHSGERQVEVLWYAKDQPIGLMARGKDGLTVDCLLMPLT